MHILYMWCTNHTSKVFIETDHSYQFLLYIYLLFAPKFAHAIAFAVCTHIIGNNTDISKDLFAKTISFILFFLNNFLFPIYAIYLIIMVFLVFVCVCVNTLYKIVYWINCFQIKANLNLNTKKFVCLFVSNTAALSKSILN